MFVDFMMKKAVQKRLILKEKKLVQAVVVILTGKLTA